MIQTPLDSSNFYFLVAVIQGLILAVIILWKQKSRKTNTFFGVLILLFSLALLHMVLEKSIYLFNSKYPIPMDFTLAYGPLAYLHIIYIKDPLRKFRANDLLHFLPSLLIDVCFFTTVYAYAHFNMEWAMQNVGLIRTIIISSAIPSIIQLAIYTYLIYRELKETQFVLRGFSKVKRWVSFLITYWCLQIGALLVIIPMALLFVEQLDQHAKYLYLALGTLLALWIYVSGYMYLLRYSNVIENYINKISKFKFSAKELESKKTQVLYLLKEQKLYRDANLTVAKLAGNLGWPVNNLSGLINEVLDTNFNDLINQFRIAEFKQKVLTSEGSKYSIVGLGQEVGFSSKASFYRAFKKETGITPSEFLKNSK